MSKPASIQRRLWRYQTGRGVLRWLRNSVFYGLRLSAWLLESLYRYWLLRLLVSLLSGIVVALLYQQENPRTIVLQPAYHDPDPLGIWSREAVTTTSTEPTLLSVVIAIILVWMMFPWLLMPWVKLLRWLSPPPAPAQGMPYVMPVLTRCRGGRRSPKQAIALLHPALNTWLREQKRTVEDQF